MLAPEIDNFGQDLARLGCQVNFCIDGLEHTHSMYRQNTVSSRVLDNAQTFIQAGGAANWAMLVFEHNQHEVEPARQLALDMGFQHFSANYTQRSTGPVFNATGQFQRMLAPKRWNGPTELAQLIDYRPTGHMSITDEQRARTGPITCEAQHGRSVYIASNGEVYPCCYTGFYPRTYGRNGCYHQPVNAQLREIIQPNNALELGLEQAIAWFDQFPGRWQLSSLEQGRLLVCSDVCGS